MSHEENIELANAERSVVIAKARLRNQLEVAVSSGKRLVKRTAARAKPTLMVVAGVGLLALTAGLYGILRPRRRPSVWRAPRRPSVLSEMFRAAAVAAASRLTILALSRLQPPPLLPPGPARRVRQ